MDEQDDAKSGSSGKKIWPTVVKWIKRLLVLAVGSIILLAGLDFWEQYQREQEKEREKTRVEAMVLIAQDRDMQKPIVNRDTSKFNEGLPIIISAYTEPDPASGNQIVRSVTIYSEDGLCRIKVEKRLSGTELTGIYCKNITIYAASFIDNQLKIKFDTDDSYSSARLTKFSDSESVYLSSKEMYKDYRTFVKKIRCSNSLALKIPAAYSFWTRFDLAGTSKPIGQLGKTKDFEPPLCGNGKPNIDIALWNVT
jgi:hypothetical protein